MTDTSGEQEQEVPPTENPRVFSLRFSGPGLLVAAFFFALSLTPSLLPRGALFQGVVAGVTMTIGYGIGVAGQALWNFLRLPVPERGSTTQRVIVGVAVLVIGVFTVLSMWRYVGWQNDARGLLGQDPGSPTAWFTIVPVTVVIAALILIISRSLRKLFRFLARWVEKILPRRAARLVGGIAVVVLVVTLVNGVLIEGFFAVANQAFSARDTDTAEDVTQPQDPERSGSPESLVPWDTLGRQGRTFTGTGPTIDDLNAFGGAGAAVPIRVYVGLNSADTLQERADLVLEELKRTGAFDREVLVVATTTGTGFLEPAAMQSLEYLHSGNTAIAGVQYSFLPSWISILADQETTKETSRVVFSTVHDYWQTLPEDTRPDIYLFGLSLGSFGVESILTSINIVNEPIDGALLVGPPFVNDLWNEITQTRDERSPAWQPIYQQGRTVRFTALENALGNPTGEWQETKVVYLQHASDPITFFSGDLAFSEPDWLKEGQRGPDVSDKMQWQPIITMWQVAGDLAVAGNVPRGHGHLYKSAEYLDGWIGISQPDGWTDADTLELADFLNAKDAADDLKD